MVDGWFSASHSFPPQRGNPSLSWPECSVNALWEHAQFRCSANWKCWWLNFPRGSLNQLWPGGSVEISIFPISWWKSFGKCSTQFFREFPGGLTLSCPQQQPDHNSPYFSLPCLAIFTPLLVLLNKWHTLKSLSQSLFFHISTDIICIAQDGKEERLKSRGRDAQLQSSEKWKLCRELPLHSQKFGKNEKYGFHKKCWECGEIKTLCTTNAAIPENNSVCSGFACTHTLNPTNPLLCICPTQTLKNTLNPTRSTNQINLQCSW